MGGSSGVPYSRSTQSTVTPSVSSVVVQWRRQSSDTFNSVLGPETQKDSFSYVSVSDTCLLIGVFLLSTHTNYRDVFGRVVSSSHSRNTRILWEVEMISLSTQVCLRWFTRSNVSVPKLVSTWSPSCHKSCIWNLLRSEYSFLMYTSPGHLRTDFLSHYDSFYQTIILFFIVLKLRPHDSAD